MELLLAIEYSSGLKDEFYIRMTIQEIEAVQFMSTKNSAYLRGDNLRILPGKSLPIYPPASTSELASVDRVTKKDNRSIRYIIERCRIIYEELYEEVEVLFEEEKTTLDQLMDAFPDIEWDWSSIVHNDGCSISLISKHSEKILQYFTLHWNFGKEISDKYKLFLDFFDQTDEGDIKIGKPEVTPWDEIDRNPEAEWNWKHISRASDLNLKFVFKHRDKPWNFRTLSCNKYITLKFVLSLPDKEWNWQLLSSKMLISFKDVFNNQHLNWDYAYLSGNLKTTVALVLALPEKPWDNGILCGNPALNPRSLLENKMVDLTYLDSIMANPSVDLDFIKEHKGRLNEFARILCNNYFEFNYRLIQIKKLKVSYRLVKKCRSKTLGRMRMAKLCLLRKGFRLKDIIKLILDYVW